MDTKAVRLAKIAEIAQKVQAAGAAYSRLSAREKTSAMQRVVKLQAARKVEPVASRQADANLNKPYGV